MVLNVGGSGLAVGVVPQATCRACDLAPVVLTCPAGRFFFIATKISTNPAVEDTASRRRGLRIFHSAKMGSACSEDTRLRYGAN